MSSDAPRKRQRTSTAEDPYELLYWPSIPGRGEFIRICFAATSTELRDVCNEQKDGIKELLGLIDSKNADAAGEFNVPAFAPPLLRHGDLVLSQTPAILSYVGPALGLVPSAEDDPAGAAKVLGLALTALDGFSNETHDTHHPVAVMKTYEEQKDQAKLKADDYRANRIPKFLSYFERVLSSKASNGGEWLYGGQMTFADLVLYQALNGVSHAFPKCIKNIKAKGEYQKIWALYERIENLESVKKYLSSDKRQKYSSGIYRHYPELDDE